MKKIFSLVIIALVLTTMFLSVVNAQGTEINCFECRVGMDRIDGSQWGTLPAVFECRKCHFTLYIYDTEQGTSIIEVEVEKIVEVEKEVIVEKLKEIFIIEEIETVIVKEVIKEVVKENFVEIEVIKEVTKEIIIEKPFNVTVIEEREVIVEVPIEVYVYEYDSEHSCGNFDYWWLIFIAFLLAMIIILVCGYVK